ncbi:hypothetical protein RHCH11_RHCH11_02891 [Beijerinckiaceae bacterium RH CH11]|nr:hypothetical protein [Beijerinckiaceae bacterium]VVB47711.1 hypothetical protein RHCH11_RHCH11_02891 [Beijerinckiaceae bacterium RH CH11]VVB47792.1 hypothetical protein RHAL8_02887 [Beijerinckiaceae bacterium RH AL8]
MVYRLKDKGQRISGGYEIIDPNRPLRLFVLGVQKPSVEFLHPNKVDWLATRKSNPMTVGCAVDPETVPRMVRRCGKQSVHVVDVGVTHDTMLISERVRDVMEHAEPGVHQFLPVDVYISPRPFEIGEAPVARSYWLVVGQHFDFVSAEDTHQPRAAVINPDGSTAPRLWDFSGTLTNQPKSNAPVIFDREAIGERQMWVDRSFINAHHPFISDDLGREMIEMNLYGAEFQHFDEA